MNIEALKQGIIDYAQWLKDYKQRGDKSGTSKFALTEKLLAAFPAIDPQFEDKKFPFELRNATEATFSKMLDTLLKPIVESASQDPEYDTNSDIGID